MRKLPDWRLRAVLAALIFLAAGAPGWTQTNVVTPPVAPALHVKKIRALDADNHNILLNRPNFITVVLGTSEESQDAARTAGTMMYPLQGRPDFQLIVVVDLRDSMATWLPSVVLEKMRTNLDEQAIELKPYFVKNGNKGNPRQSSYVVADFTGTVCPLLGWTENSDSLRGILYGVDGKEIKRWDKISDMSKFQSEIRSAIQALIDAEKVRTAAAIKTEATRMSQLPSLHPPLLPPAPVPAADN